jgi:hypothetical protein
LKGQVDAVERDDMTEVLGDPARLDRRRRRLLQNRPSSRSSPSADAGDTAYAARLVDRQRFHAGAGLIDPTGTTADCVS